MTLANLEYEFRKTERALRMLIKYKTTGVMTNKFQLDHLTSSLRATGYKLGQLRKELYRRTGTTIPSNKQWPL